MTFAYGLGYLRILTFPRLTESFSGLVWFGLVFRTADRSLLQDLQSNSLAVYMECKW